MSKRHGLHTTPFLFWIPARPEERRYLQKAQRAVPTNPRKHESFPRLNLRVCFPWRPPRGSGSKFRSGALRVSGHASRGARFTRRCLQHTPRFAWCLNWARPFCSACALSILLSTPPCFREVLACNAGYPGLLVGGMQFLQAKLTRGGRVGQARQAAGQAWEARRARQARQARQVGQVRQAKQARQAWQKRQRRETGRHGRQHKQGKAGRAGRGQGMQGRRGAEAGQAGQEARADRQIGQTRTNHHIYRAHALNCDKYFVFVLPVSSLALSVLSLPFEKRAALTRDACGLRSKAPADTKKTMHSNAFP